MEIRNKTKRPLTVPLPAGKKLFLGPGKTGQITPKAASHPPLQKLIEDDELEVLSGGRPAASGGAGGTGSTGAKGPGGGHVSEGGVRHTGDR